MAMAEITKEDFEQVLKEEKGWTLNNESTAKEYVYDFPLSSRPHIVVRVCSSINKHNDTRRACGKDAIRVFSVNIKKNIGWIKTKRVYRTEGWKKNLQTAILNCFNAARERADK